MIIYNITFTRGDRVNTNDIKNIIKDMIDKIDEYQLLKRIYNLVSYIYTHKAGK